MNEIKLLESFIDKKTNYTIDVIDNSMLPEKLKKRKTIDFTVKPPTMEVLAKCAIPLLKIPQEVREKLTLETAIEYRQQIAEVYSVIAHGKSSDYPEWYPKFVLNNVTPKELFILMQETVLKLQSDFFLSSFQIAIKTNPMMMNQRDLTPTV